MEVLDPITYLGPLHLLREGHAHLAPKISLVTLSLSLGILVLSSVLWHIRAALPSQIWRGTHVTPALLERGVTALGDLICLKCCSGGTACSIGLA
jgi:hypothetical protein